MKASKFKKIGAGALALVLAVSLMPAGAIAYADVNPAYWNAPTAPVTPDSTLIKTYGVRAGSAGPDFLGITNTNFDFRNAGSEATTEYNTPSAAQLNGVTGAGLAIWGSSVNENPNPYYTNLYYSSFPDADTNGLAKATTWSGNPLSSSWGDSIGTRAQRADGSYTIAGLEYSPEIIFGANKKSNWNNPDYSSTNIYQRVREDQAAGGTYDPTFVNNDATNVWSQIYTLGNLAQVADGMKSGGKTTRYDGNSAVAGAVSYEKSIRGNMLYIASQIDQGLVERKKVAYLYAINNGTGYFFVPEASGLVSDDDTGSGAANGAPSQVTSGYAGNNATIDLDYLGVLPFITDTFASGTPVSGGIVMLVEDIQKSNPAVSVSPSQTDALKDVDVIIYNTTTQTDLYGTSGGKNLSGVNSSAVLRKDYVTTWARELGFEGDLVIAGDDWGTSSNQGFGTVATTADGMAPMLYCQRNYTCDKAARIAWSFSKVYPELYPNDDASYAYWVDNVYHVRTESVPAVAAYMTNQSDSVEYDSNTAATLENDYQIGLAWWSNIGQSDPEWSGYAFYNGSSRASFYDGDADSAEPVDTIGIFAPSQLWVQSAGSVAVDKNALSSSIDAARTAAADTKISTDGSNVEASAKWVTQADVDALASALSEAQAVLANDYASQKLVDDATATVDDAVKAFEAAKKPGTKSTQPSGGNSDGNSGGTTPGGNSGGNSGGSAPSGGNSDQAAPTQSGWIRFAGTDAYDTMNKIVRAGWKSSDTVILATFDGYWDALTASGLAGFYKAPVLMTGTNSLNATTAGLIKSLGVKNVLIAGGSAAVSSGVESQVKALGVNVTRLAGQNASDTARKIYAAGGTVGTWGDTAIVATGDGYWDALAASPYAYNQHAPIFLAQQSASRGTKLDSDTVKAIVGGGFARVVIVGGTAAVSSDVEGQLTGAGFKGNIARMAGADAVDTSKKIAAFCTKNGMSPNGVGAATTDGYWDALTGAALLGANGSPLILVSPGNASQADDGFVADNASSITYGFVFGGTAAVPESAVTALKSVTGK